MKRIVFIVGLFSIAFSPILFSSSLKTEQIVLVTVDGVRWQEFFTGADESLLDPEKHGVRIKKYVKNTPDQRRKALMPFFWKTLASRQH